MMCLFINYKWQFNLLVNGADTLKRVYIEIISLNTDEIYKSGIRPRRQFDFFYSFFFVFKLNEPNRRSLIRIHFI